jgi:hypothetical protein
MKPSISLEASSRAELALGEGPGRCMHLLAKQVQADEVTR